MEGSAEERQGKAGGKGSERTGVDRTGLARPEAKEGIGLERRGLDGTG